jgi:lysophospholipase L1-like esterase
MLKKLFYTLIASIIGLSPLMAVMPLKADTVDLYYVGNTGVISNANGWSETSGGAGGHAKPTLENTIIFDEHSFNATSQTFTIDENSACHDMIWQNVTNKPTFTRTGSFYLTIYGDTIYSPNMTNSIVGYYIGNIATNGLKLSGGVNIGLGTPSVPAECTLQDDLYTTGTLSTVRGNFTTNNFNVTCVTYSTAANGNARTVNAGTSTFRIDTFTAAATANSTFNGANATLIIGKSTNSTFAGNSKTFGTVIFKDKLGVPTISGNNTFNQLTIQPTTKIVCLGDSLTSGTGIATNTNYPRELILLTGDAFTAINKGTGGETTTNMLARVNADVIASNPGYSVIMGGTNDIAVNNATVIKSNLQAIYTAIQQAGIKVVAVTFPPHNGISEPNQATQDAVNYWILNNATHVDYRADAYTALEDPGTPDTLLPAYNDGSNLHLSTAGYTKLAQTIYSVMALVEDPDPYTVIFTDGTTQTVSNLFVDADAPATLTGTSTAGWAITKAAGAITVDRLKIQYSTATPGSTWTAGFPSRNLGNNTGWTFVQTDTPLTLPASGYATNPNANTATATLNGNLADIGYNPSANVSFEWGYDTGYGYTTTPVTVTSAGAFSQPITWTGILRTIYYRARVTANGETVSGAQMTANYNPGAAAPAAQAVNFVGFLAGALFAIAACAVALANINNPKLALMAMIIGVAGYVIISFLVSVALI